ncbi:phospholipase A1 member A isoform X2 [Chanos chanos]|uniref:Phospholipase A1 member A n=1 Tax=Chanos chanos TaxID=29144 RepID=A0A6J2WDH1_CHACN|nr:phospholipase A1 member A isoform X2 [Chanos chanos]
MALNGIKAVALCSILIHFLSGVGGNEHSQTKCADLSNTTWQEYRQGGKLQVQYLLLTRKNADCATLFTQDCLNHTQEHTPHFNSSLPTKVIVHGYRALGTKPSWVSDLAKALLRAEDGNVLVVDWIYGASFAYNLVVENYKEVALQISVLVNQLKNHGSPLESFHLIGVSLGAHVAGFVGTLFKGKIGRITGLDPAGPMFKTADPFDRLDSSDAMFVEAIHTDSDYFGISIPVGHIDFFPNGGMDQTGCARSRFASMYGYVICDHMRAVHIYMSALNGSCLLMGFPCSSYEEFLAGRCTSCDGDFDGKCPQIGLLKNSGLTVSPLPSLGKVYFLTTSAPPFCAHHILLELEVARLSKSAELQFTLITIGLPETQLKLRLQTDNTAYKGVLAHPERLCRVDSIQIKNTGARFYRQSNIHIESVCISGFPNNRLKPLCVKNVDVGRAAAWSHDFVQVC